MERNAVSMCALSGLLAVLLAPAAAAQDRGQLYKYTDADGRVVYTDTPPPASARNVEPKRVRANVIETNEVPLAAQIASDKYPVTLYTFDCGEICQAAEALLNRRGVPFTTVNVSEQQGAAKLMALTGATTAPVLQVGDKLVAKGLNEARWQQMLDQAGYPKTQPPRRPSQARAAAPDAATRSETAPASAGPAGDTPASGAPVGDGGYPKN